MSELADRLRRGFARFVTRVVVARPGLWRVFRRPLRRLFDQIAPAWDARRPDTPASLAAALERVPGEPKRVLDLGTGTGKAARALARRFPAAEVVGVDLSPAMIEEARRLLPRELAPRVTFEVADAAALRFEDGAFDLVVLLNMIPFFPELARVTAPGGWLVLASSSGPGTPIYVPSETVRRRLGPLGFDGFEELAAGESTALLARRRGPGYDEAQATSAAR